MQESRQVVCGSGLGLVDIRTKSIPHKEIRILLRSFHRCHSDRLFDAMQVFLHRIHKLCSSVNKATSKDKKGIKWTCIRALGTSEFQFMITVIEHFHYCLHNKLG